ncbi:OsmC family protein [Emticicia sp. 21SJ11W-3]|uniref:OsmC family protein n=1 Tax=Emticicia sp. 21SJ11W-3 TaxID=2916755 RepID=UPI0020A0ED04|nr:OsmC family protein [Emticicia sp. 21SJ11W-3]UTA66452.1 OsmC family protein [Emticicia sp. 21SJ11W-3]
MKVELVRVDDAFHFEATGVSGVTNHIDANVEIGGHNAGARPMELLLMGLGGCTAIDVILVLKKQRQLIEDLRISVEGERTQIEGTEMKPFRKINIHYAFKGTIDTEKIERAIKLSMEKYCSATAQLSPTAEITHSYSLNE